MQGQTNFSNLQNLVGPPMLKGGYLSDFFIYGPNKFRCINYADLSEFFGNMQNRVGASNLDGLDQTPI